MKKVAWLLMMFLGFSAEGEQSKDAAPAQGSVSNGRYVEKLTGAEAKRHLENVSARRKDVFRKAAADLRERGLKDTGRIEVHRTNRRLAKSTGRSGHGTSLIQSPGSSSSEGEIVTWEWDDGDYDTWEGTVYVHEYDSGTWMAVNAQFWLTDGSEWNEIWSSIIDGQSSPNYPPESEVIVSEQMLPRPPYLIAGFGLSGVAPPATAIQLVQVSPRVRNKWEAWGSCTGFGCAGAAFACNRQNPTPQEKPDVAICSAAWCIAAGINCLSTLR